MNAYNRPAVPVRDVPFNNRGETYWAAVRARGGHEYTGGPAAWEPTGRFCPGCGLCGSNVIPLPALDDTTPTTRKRPHESHHSVPA